ncbi:MAG TPA: DNA-3-methyladenine glycosylase [Gemmatimonadaceae bacterium]|nr:DNA-3-methyladenine glycosylase [Gemmatimonadaceae bacterium]
MHTAALRHLRAVDPRLAAVISHVGPCRMTPHREGTHFDALIRAIVYQQLSGKAAATIHRRVLEIYGGRPPAPAELLATPDEPLRAAGLSRQKLAYLRDLAGHVHAAALPLDRVEALDDDTILDALVAVKGIGRWTAQMFLMFRLGRPNVLPELDLGIQKGIQVAYRMRTRPTPVQVRRIGGRWAPYASVASWYLWRLLDQREGFEPAPRR